MQASTEFSFRRPLPALRAVLLTAACALVLLGGCSKKAEETPQEAAAPADPAGGRQRPIFVKIGFPTEDRGSFVVRIGDPEKIALVRAALQNPAQPHYLVAEVAPTKTKAKWNPDWSFRIKPPTLEISSTKPEGCGAAAPQEVEKHAGELCKFLPNCRWCPADAKLLSEIPRPF